MSGLSITPVSRALADWVPPEWILPEWRDLHVNHLHLDSRLVKPGDGFFALANKADLRAAHIASALAAGAVLILVDATVAKPPGFPDQAGWLAIPGLADKVAGLAMDFYQNPSADMQVIGVTGTNGKSTCVYLLAQLLQQITSKPAAIIGTLGYGVVDKPVTATGMTTPDVVSNQRILRELLNCGAATVAMEVSSHGLDQGRVAGVAFSGAVFTNLTRDHLDYHGSMAAYGAAKAKLFAWRSLQVAVINAQSEAAGLMQRSVAPGAALLTYSLDKAVAADIKVEQLSYTQEGTSFILVSPWGRCPVDSPLLGAFNVENLLAVIAITLSFYPQAWPLLAQQVRQLRAVPGRMQLLALPNLPRVLVDYAHTPDALEQALVNSRRHCLGKLWVVFGCGGNRDTGKRPLMAEVAERLADQAVVTWDNPRHEDPQAILADIRAGFSAAARVTEIADRAEAIGFAVRQAAKTDWILIAGKGHETYQLVGDQVLPFDDYTEALHALQARGDS